MRIGGDDVFDRLLRYGCGVSLIFGGAVGYGAAQAPFQKVLAVVLFFGGIAFCAVMLVQAAAEDRAERPIADDVRRVKIKEQDWTDKYFSGEFDPEDDEEEDSAEALGENCEQFSKVALNPQAELADSARPVARAASAPRAMRKFVILKKG